MNNDDKKMSKPEYFDLREKRLKLVYKILYVVAAVWIAVILSVSEQKMTVQLVPIYAFSLSVSSLFIINIFKYALMELRCMKVIGNINEDLTKQTEERYDGIWKSFSLILSLTGLFAYIQFVITSNCPMLDIKILLGVIIFISTVYFSAISFIEIFKKDFSVNVRKVLDIIGLFVSIVTSYSICSLLCSVVVK